MSKRRMFYTRYTWLVFLSVVGVVAWGLWPRTTSYIFMMTNGQQRRYIIHEPLGFRLLPEKRPLVMVFHEGEKTPEYQMQKSGLNIVANLQGFYVVYPEGTVVTDKVDHKDYGREWYDDPCCAQEGQIQFVRELVAHILATRKVDPKHIYASGVSRGSQFAYTLGCEIPDMFAAVALISGNPTQETLRACGDKKIPVLIFQEVAQDYVSEHPTDFANYFWYSQYPVIPEVLVLSNTAGQSVVEARYPGCECGDVVVYSIIHGEHGWPQDIVIGGRRVPASWLVWRFFSSHP